MNAAFKICANELKSLFVSPIAWAMLVVFIVQTAIVYLSQIATVIRWEFAGYEPQMTRTIFSGYRAVFYQLYTNLMFYVPLLTMGLISRERHNGSIKLLMSSPVTVGQVVIGKYQALLIYLFAFVVFICGLILLSGALVHDFDYGFALSGMLGLYLLACTYAAIGLFMSSLTNHQVVAAISTIALLAALSFVGTVGQRVPIVQDIAYWLSISGRADFMRAGLIASKDVLYFFFIVALFLIFTYFKLSAGRRIESKWMRGAKYAGAGAAVVVLGYVTSLPALTAYADVTRPKSQTLSGGSVGALTGMEGALDMTVLVNALDPRASAFLPAHRNSLYRRLFEQHERQIGRINVHYQFYYADSENERLYEANPGKSNEQLAREFAEQNRLKFDTFLTQDEVDARYGLDAENYRNVYLLEWQGRQSIVRNFDDPQYFPGEPAISAAIKRLIAEPVRLAYVLGQGERRIFRSGGEDHRAHMSDVRDRNALLNHGFEVEEIVLDAPVPEHLDILVLAAPIEPLPARVENHLRDYIAAGRDLLILGEPHATDPVNQVIEALGVSLRPGAVTEPKEAFPEALVFAPLSDAATELGFIMPRRSADWPIILPGAAALDVDPGSPFAVEPILAFTSEMSVSADEDGSAATPQALAVAMERSMVGETQRIVIVGDADFMSTATRSMRDPSRRNNPEFVNDLFGYLSGGAYPIDTTRPVPLDTSISITLKDMDALRIGLLGVLPGLLVIAGAWLLLVRRRP